VNAIKGFRMSRLVLALVVVGALAAGTAASASSGPAPAGAAAKKCKKTKKKKCKKTTTALALKDGNYTYKQESVGAAPVNTLTISGKGTKVRVRELFFSSGEDPGGLACAATVIDFGTLPLRRTGDLLEWSTVKRVAVPPVATQGAGGGTASTNGQINVKTLAVYVNTDVVMGNRAGQVSGGCREGHSSVAAQKLKRK